MVVWVAVWRHPPVVATRAAETAMPLRGIRLLLPGWELAGRIRCLGEHWQKCAGKGCGQDKVDAMEERAGSEYAFGLVRRADMSTTFHHHPGTNILYKHLFLLCFSLDEGVRLFSGVY